MSSKLTRKISEYLLSKGTNQTQRVILRRVIEGEGSVVQADLQHYFLRKGYNRTDLENAFQDLVDAELLSIDGMLIRLEV